MSRESYDQVPYPAAAYAETQPRNLETIATAQGLTPPPITTSRVLELGCATGGNVVPMAVALGGAQFVAIDYSPTQIERAVEFGKAVGASNLRFETKSILEINRDFGQFDYIIAHGMFSWVGSDVREKLLQICRENLSEHGVALVSFNCYPGWHAIEWLRALALFHAPSGAGQRQRSRDAIEAVLESPHIRNSPLAKLFRRTLDAYDAADPSHWLHDLMEDVNQPFYFADFLKLVEARGLQYLSDAIPTAPSSLATDDWLRREQYADFERNNTFRRALLVHRERQFQRGIESGAFTHVTPAGTASQISERPEVWKVARYQASRGATSLTNLRHEVVKLNPADTVVPRMIQLLDGSRTREQIVEELTAQYEKEFAGKRFDRNEFAPRARSALDTLLQSLLTNGLLNR